MLLVLSSAVVFAIVASSIALGAMGLIIVKFALCCYVFKRKETLENFRVPDVTFQMSTPTDVAVSELPKTLDSRHPSYLERVKATWSSRCTLFQYRELQKATEDFSPDTALGKGGFGTVYKGWLDDGRVVAIKKSNDAGTKNLEDFLNEVHILSQLNHRNLVRLLGCCIENEVPLLVYEFIPNGTVWDHLQDARQGKITELDWGRRLNIAIHTAEALMYLHVLARPPIFHRDVKSANILLDSSFDAKVADFGISRLAHDKSHVFTKVMGTLGYLDPEYHGSGQLTEKSDVFSFGALLLELITAQVLGTRLHWSPRSGLVVSLSSSRIEFGRSLIALCMTASLSRTSRASKKWPRWPWLV